MVNDDFEPTDEEEAILRVFKEQRQTVNPMYLREETDLGKGSINTALTRLTSAGWVRKVTRGLYEFVDDPRGDDGTTEAPVADAEPAVDDAPREPSPEPDPEPEPEPSSAELPVEIDARVWDAVDAIAESWDDDARFDNRRSAAAHVLQFAVDTSAVIGKSHDIVDAARREFPVDGQNRETFWRQNIRDVLSENGDYSRGKHGYSVDELE